jgi:hypothetical protein
MEASNMKFLVISRPRENQQGLTSAMVEATLDIVKAQLKAGLIDCIYAFADGSGTVGIGNADSGEALVEALETPATPFVRFEAHPLADFNKVVSNAISNLKKQGL